MGPPRRGRRTPARDDDRDDRYDSRRSGQDSERRHERQRDDHREAESRRSGRDSDRQESGQRGDARDLGRRDSRRQVREISPPRSPGPRQRPPGVSKIFIELFLVIKNPGLMECLKCLHFGKKEKSALKQVTFADKPGSCRNFNNDYSKVVIRSPNRYLCYAYHVGLLYDIWIKYSLSITELTCNRVTSISKLYPQIVEKSVLCVSSQS